MGGITTGVGLFSGINTQDLITQLLAVEARPKLLVQQRIAQLQQEQAAYLDVNSALLALQTAAKKFDQSDIFKSARATSSNPDLLSAVASTTASPGTYNMFVKRLVSSQQLLSRGFADRDASAVGASEFSFELGGGGLTSDTRLAELNGGEGISRGKFEIRDRSGGSAQIDISTAVTVNDVLDAINGATSIDVQATVRDGRIMIEDMTGQTGDLRIADMFGSDAAKDLGIEKTVNGGVGDMLVGGDLYFIGENTALSVLNDGGGINIRDNSPDIRITDRNGLQVSVNLGLESHVEGTGDDAETVVDWAKPTTVGGLVDIMNQQLADAGSTVRVAINADRTGLAVTDSSGGTGDIIVENSSADRTTAQDLGIATTGTNAASFDGQRLLSEMNSSLVRNLLGGKGLTETKFNITDRNGVVADFDLDAATLDGSVSDIIRDLNEKIEAAGAGVTARLNNAGNGIEFVDDSGGSGALIVAGAAADELGVSTDPAGVNADTWNGGNLQSKWLTRGTLLSTLNAGQGIGTGSFRITDATGDTEVITIDDDERTIDDLLQLINSRPIGVTARINGNGDGIEIVDTSGGTGTLKIENENGTVASRLNLVGEASDDGGSIAINGSFEKTLDFDGSETLEDIRDAINNANAGVSATIVNTGDPTAPYRLSLTANNTGSVGNVIVDSGNFNLGLQTLSRGQDALVFFGSDDPATAVTLTSSTNTLDDVISGVTIDLKGTSSEMVELSVSRDVEAMESAVKGFVDAFNKVLERIERYDSYDAESETRGILLGDSTVNNIRRALYRTIQSSPVGVDGPYQYLFQAGVRIGDGARLEFDSADFREALEADPENVEALFAANKLESVGGQEEILPGVFVNTDDETYSALGVAEIIDELVNNLTNSVDGLLTTRGQTLDRQIEDSTDRIRAIDGQIAVKRFKLESQFLAMERAIASLQTQGQALSAISIPQF